MIARLVVLVLAAGCGTRSSSASQPAGSAPGDAAPGDAAPDDDLRVLAARSVKLYADVAAAFRAAGANCALATTKLAELAKTYADVPAANARVEQDGRTPALKLALRPHEDALAAAANAILQSETVAKCAGDPAFDLAWHALVALP